MVRLTFSVSVCAGRGAMGGADMATGDVSVDSGGDCADEVEDGRSDGGSSERVRVTRPAATVLDLFAAAEWMP